MEREEGESEDGELIALEKALGSKLGVEVGEEGRVLEEVVNSGGGLGLVEVADLAVAVNLGGRSGTMEKTEEKSLLTVERLQSPARELVASDPRFAEWKTQLDDKDRDQAYSQLRQTFFRAPAELGARGGGPRQER